MSQDENDTIDPDRRVDWVSVSKGTWVMVVNEAAVVTAEQRAMLHANQEAYFGITHYEHPATEETTGTERVINLQYLPPPKKRCGKVWLVDMERKASAWEASLSGADEAQTKTSEPCLIPNPFADLTRQRDEAYRYLRRLFECVAPQCTPLPELIGLCTQIDNAMVGLRTDRDAWSAKCAEQATEMDRLRMQVMQLQLEKNCLKVVLKNRLGVSIEPEHNPFREFPDDRRRVGG